MNALVLCVMLLTTGSGVKGVTKQLGVPLHTDRLMKDSCDSCKDVIQDAEQYIADPKTQDAVVTFVLQNVCPMLPQDAGQTCAQEARVLVAQAVASMEQDMPPSTVCTYMGACREKGAGDLAQILAEANSLHGIARTNDIDFRVQCPLCKMVFSTVIMRLKDPESRSTIHDAAIAACNEMEVPEAASKCCSDVEHLFIDVDALLDDVDPTTACEVLQFCDRSDGARVVYGSPPKGIFKAKAKLQELLLTRPVRTSNDTCDSCMNVITEVAAILADPDTQKEVFDYVKQGCETFDSYKEQCVEYVDQYGPLVFGMVLTYLQPEPFCTQMGYCEEVSASVT